MNDLTLSKFMYEAMALGPAAGGQLPISSVCNCECIFCSNNMNPFPIHRLGFRPLEDIKKGIALLDPQAEEIRLGDSLPGRISEGEALLHPELLTILSLVRAKAAHSVIQISTNGSLLTKELVEQLKPFKPMSFTISYHSDNPEHWQRIFNRGASHYKHASESFYHLSKNGFAIEGALVPLPNLVGYEDIEHTLRTLKAWTKKVLIWGPGYTKKATAELKAILDTDFRELSAFMARMRKTYRMDLELKPDPLGPLNFAPFHIMQKTAYARRRNVLWMLSEAAYDRGKKILGDWNGYFPNEHVAVMVKNNTYGGNIICSGLLMVSDFREALKNALAERGDRKVNLILLPKKPFDHFGDDLTGQNYATLTEEFGIPIWLEDC
jgi:uncharacterized Fe-S cluster-containing radical SAM superfamily protein